MTPLVRPNTESGCSGQLSIPVNSFCFSEYISNSSQILYVKSFSNLSSSNSILFSNLGIDTTLKIPINKITITNSIIV